MMRILTLFALLLPVCVIAQSAFEFSSLKRLPPEVNTKAGELMPIVSQDGSQLYFAREVSKENIGGQFSGQDIWVSDRLDGKWQEAVRLDPFNNKGNNVVVGHDEHGRLYLLNSYEDNYGGRSGLSFSDRNGDFWTPPVVTKIEGVYNRENNDLYGLHVNKKADVLLISMKGEESLGLEDLYVSFKFTGWNRFYKEADESSPERYWWSKPIHLGEVINSSGFEISPFLSNDGKVLFFSSNRKGGLGNADIYYSERLDDTWKNWSTPINLGSTINSPQFDAYFMLTSDSMAYFSSARFGGFAEIYSSRLQSSQKPILEDREESYAYEPTIEKNDTATSEAPTSLPTPITTKEQLDSLNKTKANILFDHNSSNLLLRDKDLLQECIDVLMYNAQLEVHLTGHTDHIGDLESNKKLSIERANAVKSYFLKMGIDASKVHIDGHGEDVPLFQNESKKGREKNRRVKILFRFIE